MDLTYPEDFDLDPAIFEEIDTVDRDTLKQHLVRLSPEEARLSQMWAEAAYMAVTYERAAKKREAQAWLEAKRRPVERETVKNGMCQVDASDDYADMMAKSNEEALELWGCRDLWVYRRDELKGYLSSLSNKSSLVSSLAGITRTEMQGAYQNSR